MLSFIPARRKGSNKQPRSSGRERKGIMGKKASISSKKRGREGASAITI